MKRIRNLLIATEYDYPRFGGGGRVIENEIRFFKKVLRLTLLCRHWSTSAVPNGFDVVLTQRVEPHGPLHGFLRTIIDSTKISFKLHKLAFNPSVIHCHDILMALSSIIAGYARRTVFHMHSPPSSDIFTMGTKLSDIHGIKLFMFLVEHLFERMIDMFVVNSVRFIICVSEFELDYVRSITLRQNNLKIIRNGVDLCIFRPDHIVRKMWRHKLGIQEQAAVVLFLGDMVPKNGVLIFAQAIIDFMEYEPIRVYLFVGDGPDKPELERKVVASGRKDILILPAMPAENVMPCGDIFVSHLSSLVEGFGLTIIEALACGLTVIIGRDRITSTVLPPSSAIVLVQKDDPRAVAYAIKRYSVLLETESIEAREVANKFSVEKTMKALENVLVTCSIDM